MIPLAIGFVEPKALEMAHGWRTNPTAALHSKQQVLPVPARDHRTAMVG
jgi:hypothetical protein